MMKYLLEYLIYRTLAFAMTVCYFAFQFVMPDRALTWLANISPTNISIFGLTIVGPDVFMPRALFEPMPHRPPRSKYSNLLDDVAWQVSSLFLGWLNPIHLLRVARDAAVTGNVIYVETAAQRDGASHDTFYIRPDDPSILNRFAWKLLAGAISTGTAGLPLLKCYVPIGTAMPAVGVRVRAQGMYGVDLANGGVGLSAAAKRWTVIR
jgi:hypothetical protein